MKRPATALSLFSLLLSTTACALLGQPEPKEVAPPTPTEPPPPQLVVAEEFGPLQYRISPDLRTEWERVLELHQRLFARQGKEVEEDDLHRLYNDADVNDDDLLDQTEVDEAFRRMKRDYEKNLSRAD